MRIEPTPHAANTARLPNPAYRVNFWTPSGEVWALRAFVITGATDVTEVLQWVEENKDGQHVEVFAEMDTEPVEPGVPRQAGFVRLLGNNPNPGKSSHIGTFVKKTTPIPELRARHYQNNRWSQPIDRHGNAQAVPKNTAMHLTPEEKRGIPRLTGSDLPGWV